MKYSYLIIALFLFSNCNSQSSKSKTVASNESVRDSLVIKKDSLSIDDEEVYLVVDEMPRFPGCEEEEPVARKNCSDRKLLQYFHSNIKFDPVARENNAIASKIVFSFVVEKDGIISNFELIKGTESKWNIREVVKSMPLWIPGKLRGIPRRVKFNLPFYVHLK